MKNFFEQQETARRKSAILILLYVIGVGIAITIPALPFLLLDGTLGVITFFIVAGFHLLVIGVVVTEKRASLQEGGSAVADDLNGVRLRNQAGTETQQQFYNVVEEMAIAAGVPMPAVYGLDEDGINAFAAGYTPEDAVIGVTRGAITHLDRDELQGMIAHVFSQILNGDMRLNLQLLSWTWGLQFLMIESLRRLTCFPLTMLFYLSAALMGAAGYGWANLMKGYVSHERTFLADAAAVEFTRSKTGIGGALSTILYHDAESTIEADEAEAANHFFFARTVERSFSAGRFDAHPSVWERIQRIGYRPRTAEEDDASPSSDGSSAASSEASASSSDHTPSPEQGEERSGPLQQAEALRAALPDELLSLAHEPIGAAAVSYALVLNEEASMQERQLDLLKEREPPAVVDETKKAYSSVAALEQRLRLPLVELSAPALRDLSSHQRSRLLETLPALAESDEHLTIFEIALSTVVRHQLERHDQPRGLTDPHRRFEAIADDVAAVLSKLAHTAHANEDDAQAAFRKAYDSLPESDEADPATLTRVDSDTLGRALDRLSRATPELKEAVLAACVECVRADDRIGEQEEMLLRAVAAASGVPVPARLGTEGNLASEAHTTGTT